jgi:hypothetical protein
MNRGDGIMRLAGAALIGLLLTTQLAFGGTAESSDCPSVEIVRAVLKEQFPGTELKHFRGDNARRFINAYNNIPASSHWPADEVLIARNPNTPERARIGFFKQGCLLALVARSTWTVDSLERSLVPEQDV